MCSSDLGPPIVPGKGRVLLFVHGTFSETSAILDQLQATDDGRRFLSDAASKYDALLAFDHPTISVSPMLNAFDLQKLSDLPANLERLLDVKLEVTKRTKGDSENVYFNHRIVLDEGAAGAGWSDAHSGSSSEDVPF